MAFEITTSSYRLERRRGTPFAEAARTGAYAGLGGVFFALIGAYSAMDKRFIVEGALTLSQAVLLVFGVAAGLLAAGGDGSASARPRALMQGLEAGAAAGLLMATLLLIISHVNLRDYLVATGPDLTQALSFAGVPGSLAAAGTLVVLGLATGALGALLALAPSRLRRVILAGVLAVGGVGLFRDVVADVMNNLGGRSLQRVVFGRAGVRVLPAAVLFGVVAAVVAFWPGGPRRPSTGSGTVTIVAMLAGAVILPFITSDFIAQVLILVALYVLMAMGLNIELGLAGLVDLGFVAFYAVGAYTVALLCSASPIAVASLSFWVAFPIAILCAALAGLVFGLPVLRVRGDYLALATLGLGEIIRVLVVSDLLRPLLGGSQGIIAIRRPEIGGLVLNTPLRLYFFAFALAAVGALVTHRLRDSRVGRAWLAIREDEEVAQGLGIDLVGVKLLAYTIGAAMAGAAGAVFAVLIGAVYPHSFQLLISVNLLSILVIGGLGSLPGVAVGALVLVGLPELLREFGEYRYLFYGLALIAMVNFRAEGLWPAGRVGVRGAR